MDAGGCRTVWRDHGGWQMPQARPELFRRVFRRFSPPCGDRCTPGLIRLPAPAFCGVSPGDPAGGLRAAYSASISVRWADSYVWADLIGGSGLLERHQLVEQELLGARDVVRGERVGAALAFVTAQADVQAEGTESDGQPCRVPARRAGRGDAGEAESRALSSRAHRA